jgi:glutamate 5-kinase
MEAPRMLPRFYGALAGMYGDLGNKAGGKHVGRPASFLFRGFVWLRFSWLPGYCPGRSISPAPAACQAEGMILFYPCKEGRSPSVFCVRRFRGLERKRRVFRFFWEKELLYYKRRKYMKIVIKVGTGVLTRENGTLDGSSIVHLVSALAGLMQQGHQVVLVSSGAVGAGVSVLGLPSYPQELSLKQACAAVGQTRLMQAYENLFNHFNVDVAQLLLTAEDLKRRRGNVQATVLRLFEHGGIIPIVNENDTVSVEELKFGDNDILSVHIARLVEADALFILTSVDGLYPPGGKRKAIIPRVEDVDAVLAFAEEDRGRFSMGGMSAKLQAVREAVNAGTGVYMLHGRHPERIALLLEGKEEGAGTYFVPKG